MGLESVIATLEGILKHKKGAHQENTTEPKEELDNRLECYKNNPKDVKENW